MAERGAAMSHQIGDVTYGLRNQALPGSLAVALGDYPAAAQRLRPLVARWRASGERLVTAGSFVPDAVEALAATGETAAAAAIVAGMEGEAGNPFAAAVTARCRAWLAAAQGDHDAAAAAVGQALRWFGELPPMPAERGRALLVLGGVQRRLKQRGAARATLTEALGLFEGAGARLWAGRARAELARISGRSPGPVTLSVTEDRVAGLVARGLSNRDVAAELFVTVRAVESTLTKVYAKLGVRSRTELAARLRAGPPG
jgi:DNA-binding CsgD family transcriptional regulator